MLTVLAAWLCFAVGGFEAVVQIQECCYACVCEAGWWSTYLWGEQAAQTPADSSLIYILLSNGPNRQANKGWQSWEATVILWKTLASLLLLYCQLAVSSLNMQCVVCSAIMHTRLCNPAHFASLNCYTQLLMSIWTLSNKVFCLSAPWKKHSDLSFSDDPKVYQMRGRERVEGEYWEKKRVRERERWKCKNKETKKMEIWNRHLWS